MKKYIGIFFAPSFIFLVAVSSAQAYLDEAGIETSTPTITEIKPEKKEKTDAKLANENHAVFLERSSETARGTSSNQEITFLAAKVSGKIQISFILNGKQFLFVYEAISLREKKLNSIQLIPDLIAQNKKTKDDDAILILLYKELDKEINRLDPLEGGILSSLDLLINMVPLDESFDKIDLQGAKEKGLIQPEAFTTICGNRGRVRTGLFDGDDGTVYTRKRIVGNPASACIGRCGKGCFQPTQLSKRQYTDECFVHDLCTGHFDTILGNCSDEFNAAIDGYNNALNCSFYVIGKWILDYDWDCDGVNGSVTLTLYSDYSWVSSGGFQGTWERNGDKIIRTYDNGTKYTGTIQASNMKTKGTILSHSGNTGCFTDTYLTTSTD